MSGAMKKLVGDGFVASFIGQEPAKATFVGLYSIEACRPLTYKQFWKIRDFAELKSFGMKGWTIVERDRPTVLWYPRPLYTRA